MKKLILTCSLIAAGSMVSFAQNVQTAAAPTATTARAVHAAPAPEALAERKARTTKQQLGLTDEQYKGVYEAELNYAKQDQVARTGGNQPGEGQVMQMGMMRDQKIKSILTAEQYTKYQAHNPARAASQTAPAMTR